MDNAKVLRGSFEEKKYLQKGMPYPIRRHFDTHTPKEKLKEETELSSLIHCKGKI